MKLIDRTIDSKLAFSILILPFLLLMVVAFITLNKGTRDIGIWLLAENHPVEMMTFVFLLAGSIYGLKIAMDIRNTRNKYVIIFYAIFSILLFIVAMEEIAWGQQLFDFETPESWKRINVQGETTLHNIEGLQGKSEIFRLIYGLAGLIGILFSRFPFFNDLSPSKLLYPWFILISFHALIDVYTDLVEVNEFYDKGIQRTSELIELLIAISAFIFLWLNRIKFLGN